MGRGADFLLYYLELLRINFNLINNTWNTPFPNFNPMRWRINNLRVYFAQCRIAGNPDGNWGGFIVVPSGIVGNQLEPDWKHLDYPSPQPQSTANDNIKPGSHFSHISASPLVDSRWALG